MFERYTEKARRVIFFSRYEASQFGAPYIETEHILLGLLREDKALMSQVLGTDDFDAIRRQIEGTTIIREKFSTSVDLPLSNECKRILAYSAEEAERLAHRWIGPEHILLGTLREERCFAAELLHERGLRIEHIRELVRRMPASGTSPGGREVAAKSRMLDQGLIEFVSDDDGSPIGSMPSMIANLPYVGDEILINDSLRFRVTRVVHRLVKHSKEAEMILPKKVVVYLKALE